MQAPCGVFAEHQVLPVGQGEGLLVGALDRGLHRGTQGLLGALDQLDQGQFIGLRAQAHLQGGGTALAMRRGQNALGGAEPGQHLLMVEGLIGEVLAKALLDQLAGQGGGAGAGRGIVEPNL
ncbi:hypothetical protein D3C84_692460 [compost metagenome]